MTSPYAEESLTQRITTPAAEALLGKKFDCLDRGFVYLVDYMGGDASIVQSARVSYGLGTKTVSEDRGLIRYLMRHQHSTPFEMVELKFHLKMPIFVARQMIRHRTANVNEYSGRYSIMPDEFYVPSAEHVSVQSATNRQGGGEQVDAARAAEVIALIDTEQRMVRDGYEKMLDWDIRRELARVNLGVSQYTEWYWKNDLHNIFHFLKLRLDDHAQYEIRVYAEAMAQIVKAVAPIAWEAFEDYSLNATRFSGLEIEALSRLLGGSRDGWPTDDEVHASLPEAWRQLTTEGKLKRNRERDEFLDKMRALRGT
ncbi:MAG TPA: FAD-dependent thymidylate synthase [Blastocatellia bacterium]|nr:FAD-dependent thymidylate synthase [Blastocatellia bacterium]